MKNYLYVLLLLLVALVIGCSKENEPEEGDNGGGDPDKEWIMIDDITVDKVFQEDMFGEATIWLSAELKHPYKYILNYYRWMRIFSTSEKPLYLGTKNGPVTERECEWGNGVSTVVVLPQEPGAFDFYIEIDCNTESRPYAFRSRVYRLVLSRIEGGWNIDSFGLAPGQEEPDAAQ